MWLKEGWIEIWNASASATTRTSLANWRLTTASDGSTFWLFPAIEIAPDERIIVWASGKNRRVATAPLHTNFTLTKAGGYLALRNSANSIVSEFNPYPAQQDDVSYGRDFAEKAQVGAYTNPTPGDPNNYSGAGVARHVIFSQTSKAFTGSLSLTLTGGPTAAVIRYTSTAPRRLRLRRCIPRRSTSEHTIVRARVFKPRLLPARHRASASCCSTARPRASARRCRFAVDKLGAGQPPDTGDQPAYVAVGAGRAG